MQYTEKVVLSTRSSRWSFPRLDEKRFHVWAGDELAELLASAFGLWGPRLSVSIPDGKRLFPVSKTFCFVYTINLTILSAVTWCIYKINNIFSVGVMAFWQNELFVFRWHRGHLTSSYFLVVAAALLQNYENRWHIRELNEMWRVRGPNRPAVCTSYCTRTRAGNAELLSIWGDLLTV